MSVTLRERKNSDGKRGCFKYLKQLFLLKMD